MKKALFNSEIIPPPTMILGIFGVFAYNRPMPATLADVRAYYDKNTPLFLRYGSSPETQTIHRSLWPQGVHNLEKALEVSNNLVLEEARSLGLAQSKILDLGCGVGATLFHVLS